MADQAAGDTTPVIVALPPEIDVANVGEVYDLLCAAVGCGARVIVADLSATEFCDAAGVRLLVMIRDQAAARGGQLRLVISPGGLLRRMLVVLGADHLLPVYATAEDASRPVAAPQFPLFSAPPPNSRARARRPGDVS
jgi:anti-anti-sigma factor